ncbi:DgyrCDS3712 [Dimorphilus gyrociliatus]|uniref:Protein tyrosine phosphatase type IVA 3 n=1 Tax=Dimorphilus gyrociliatus TaxID=2664684 RepID=A0A7I8VG93_9ANNE|nr:DgyrCDS3712 [Dimorphilus gyrociliatus]
MVARLPEPTLITHKNMKFYITNCPKEDGLDSYIQDLKRVGVRDLVRVCPSAYSKEPIQAQGINVIDWPFDDGYPPPEKIVDQWFDLLKNRFKNDPGSCVAVHCVAGLGRAPVLVAVALIECGMKYESAVEMIRAQRRGAINANQLEFLKKYRPKGRLKANGKQCCIM